MVSRNATDGLPSVDMHTEIRTAPLFTKKVRRIRRRPVGGYEPLERAKGFVGETFSTARGEEWRILAIETEIAAELHGDGFNAVFTVEPA
jgi:hypothetical protein